MLGRKQASLWAQGDLFRAKLTEQMNGQEKVGVTRILSGVDDISINDDQNRMCDELESHVVCEILEHILLLLIMLT